ncbi:DUF6069 family protein [Mobilicoccus caccae]|uniref:Uncharacterized protein n=1 Tax=Mobilicoccus caccae TaxID=1859295 RepID=A0ABQ6IZ37_9MICO|nr:DUF6069 family protein [Mobilicoccus caccae]GMA41958.1 hypothetical protein GCM10025883_40030 [Mobilicoccus caccae]
MSAVLDDHSTPTTRVGARTTAVLTPVLVVAVVVNLTVHALGRAAGADFTVRTPSADQPQVVGWVSVLVMSIVPVLIGSLLLWATRRSPRAWVVLAWVGLVVGVLSVGMPVLATATTGTKLALATMHLLPAVTWWVCVRRELDRADRVRRAVVIPASRRPR